MEQIIIIIQKIILDMEKNVFIFFLNCQCTWKGSFLRGNRRTGNCFMLSEIHYADANNQPNGLQSPRALGKNYTKCAISRGRKKHYMWVKSIFLIFVRDVTLEFFG